MADGIQISTQVLLDTADKVRSIKRRQNETAENFV